MLVQITGYDGEYYSGTVTIEDETVSFEAQKENAYGEFELHKYSEPGWFTGASYDKPVPSVFVERAEEIAQAIQTAVNDYVYSYANDRHGVYAKRNQDFSYTVARDPSYSVTQDTSLPFDLLNSTLDFVIASEDYCVSNFEMAFDLYDFYTGRLYRVTFTDCEKYMNGELVTLYGHIPDADEQQRLMEFDRDTFPDKEVFRVVE